MNVVILAGGVGTRLWPLSRRKRPKQFTPLLSEQVLLRDTYDRLRSAFGPEQIYVSISPAFVDMLRKTLPELQETHMFVEPEKRDTGAAMGYVAARLEEISPEESVTFVPSDHYVRDVERYVTSIRVAGEVCERTGKLLDIAIPATFPSTILGYTHIGERSTIIDGIEVFEFLGHTEKPSLDVATVYVKDGSYLWHANYYTWTPAKFLEAFDTYAPEMGSVFREIQGYLHQGKEKAVELAFSRIPTISFDYAVTEKMHPKDVLIVKGSFGWSDIGGWDTLFDRLQEDLGVENVLHGDALVMDAKNNMVHTSGKKLVALVGVEDLVVVDTDDALLVMRKDHGQDVGGLVARLKDEGREDVL